MRGFALLFAVLLTGAVAAEHCVFDAISLDGEWEMAYRPYPCESVVPTTFKGVRVADAVPGYWEDLIPALRAAGMSDEFRVHPTYQRETLPVTAFALDTMLPNVYGCFFYRRTVEIPDTRRAVLAFEGVRNQVHVWVNGRFAAFRAGFSTPFELELPADALKRGTNEIVLAVSNNPNLGYLGSPVIGLTTRAMFAGTGGINGHLELRFPRNALADVHVTTASDLKSFTVHTSGNVEAAYAILDGVREMCAGRAKGDFTLSSEGFGLWSPENPKRYELVLRTAEGEYRQKFGLRRLIAEDEKLKLNGRPVYLRGVTEHCYFPEAVHLPRDLGYYRRITAVRKELGFNFVRFHTYVPPVEYLEAMDELGMLVHIESPNFVTEAEYRAIVDFTRRHPCVVLYCTGNETRIDRLVEVYLEEIANIVHERSDALFTPISALRGVEYCLTKHDPVVDAPFRHNAERVGRLSRFSDALTSYQRGMASYDPLNSPGPDQMDRQASAYVGKPVLSHEICIGSSYLDPSLESRYPTNSPILRTGIFSEPRKLLESRGLWDRVPAYFRNSCEWMRRLRKFTFEKIRASDRTSGYDFLGDINSHWHTFGYSVGMMDEFYRLKPGETVKNVLRYNSAAVLFCDLGSDFNVLAGERKRVTFKVSNYDAEMPDASITVRLSDDSGSVVWTEERPVGVLPNGVLSELGAFDLEVPQKGTPAKLLLQAKLADGTRIVENEWELYAFPRCEEMRPSEGVTVVTDIAKDELLKLLAEGRRVVLFGRGPFNALPLSFNIGNAGRCAGNFATVVKTGHPALAGFPHEGYCGWQFRRLMEGGQAVQLEAGVPFDPIVDVASAVKYPIRQAALFEYRVGDGRLLVCSFHFGNADPAAAWLRNRLLDYAASSEFAPVQTLAVEQLRAVIEAPKLSGAANNNVARNPRDASSDVRAGDLTMP